MGTLYNKEFFSHHKKLSISSANFFVPKIIKLTGCNSVLDVGCGRGYWLLKFSELGVKDFFGIDGDYVYQDLVISKKLFNKVDLVKPFDLGRSFDIAICLEVAEHIPKAYAKSFIKSLTKHSKVVVFSAAIPFQGGTNHVNEQWPPYWEKIFNDLGYIQLDPFRELSPVCDDAFWYNQNMFLYVKKELLSKKRFSSICQFKGYYLIHKSNQLVAMERFGWFFLRKKIEFLLNSLKKIFKLILNRFSL